MLGNTLTSQYYAYGSTYNGFGSPATFVANGTVLETFRAGCPEGFGLTVTDTRVIYSLF